MVAASSQALLVFHIMGPLGSLPLATITYKHNIRVVKGEKAYRALLCSYAYLFACLLSISYTKIKHILYTLSIFYIPGTPAASMKQ